MPSFDVAIVGAGITGCLAASRLASRGAHVALLDAGPDPFARSPSTPLPPPDAKRQPVQSQLHSYSLATAPFLVDDIENPYTTEQGTSFLWFRGRQVGGRMHLWDGWCPRLIPEQLLDAWPLYYEELEPYYRSAEADLRVEIGELSATERHFRDTVEKHFPDYLAQPCPISTLAFSELRKRLDRLRSLSVIPDAIVFELVWDSHRRRVRALRYIERHSGAVVEIEARAYFLCASTIESTRVLLNSISPDFPEGLGNSSGVLGKFLMDHVCAALHIAGEPPPPSRGMYVSPRSGAFNDGYCCEGTLAAPNQFWICAFSEVDASPNNYVCLDDVAVDRWGLRAPRIRLVYSEGDLGRARTASSFVNVASDGAGLTRTKSAPEPQPPGWSIHEVGTARMGKDPRSSFLNKFNQSWDVPNLFVTDGAAFPTSGYQNPTLTMCALTLRACDVASAELHTRHVIEPLVPRPT